ncbi:hypothetical protein U1Q18_004224 [Sarracenia purpurea var. burkii]
MNGVEVTDEEESEEEGSGTDGEMGEISEVRTSGDEDIQEAVQRAVVSDVSSGAHDVSDKLPELEFHIGNAKMPKGVTRDNHHDRTKELLVDGREALFTFVMSCVGLGCRDLPLEPHSLLPLHVPQNDNP